MHGRVGKSQATAYIFHLEDVFPEISQCSHIHQALAVKDLCALDRQLHRMKIVFGGHVLVEQLRSLFQFLTNGEKGRVSPEATFKTKLREEGGQTFGPSA